MEPAGCAWRLLGGCGCRTHLLAMTDARDRGMAIAVGLGNGVLLHDHGGGFAPAMVELHLVSAENYAGDPGEAVATALRIVPASLPTTERRALYWTDTARAYANWGRRDDCVCALLAAEREAPEETHARPRYATWCRGCWSPAGPGRNCGARLPGAASADQFRYASKDGRGTAGRSCLGRAGHPATRWHPRLCLQAARRIRVRARSSVVRVLCAICVTSGWDGCQ
jgi:hypothetical protein